jgi:HNH endonuclease
MKKLKSIKGIPLSYIKSVIKIDPLSPSGLTWLPRKDKSWNTRYASKYVGNKNINKKGYISWVSEISYNSKPYRVICSRVIFLLHNKYLTEGKFIDHADGNSLNNNPYNLRESTFGQNNLNTKLRKNNTSGNKCVIWHKPSGKWQVRIKLNCKSYSFGYFVNKEDAIKVAIKERKKLHGDFGRNQ